MAKEIHFIGAGLDFTGGITKVDRKKVYGYSEVEVKDDKGSLCSLATLSEDGSHILPSGCTGITRLDSQSNYIESSSMKAIDLEGNPAEVIPSVFDQDVTLREVDSIDEYLDLNVKAIYQLDLNEEDKAKLAKYLSEKYLLAFNFNYRSDYEEDDAFLLESEGEIFAVVGKKCEFEYQGLELIEAPEEDQQEEEDDFDFGML